METNSLAFKDMQMIVTGIYKEENEHFLVYNSPQAYSNKQKI